MDNVKVGQFIKEELKKQGITQEQLAEKLGISSSAVSQNLSGKNSFDISNLMEIAKILDMDLDIIVNAGEERETNLERLSKMSFDKFIKEDPECNKLNETDSKGLKLSRYLVKHKNVELISNLLDKGLKRQYQGDILFLALALKYYKELGLNLSYFNGVYRELRLENKGKKSRRNAHTEYDLLTEEKKVFVDSLLELEDKEILDVLGSFKEGTTSSAIPIIVYYAVQFDKKGLVEYWNTLQDNFDRSIGILQEKNRKLFEFAITHKSKNCITYLHGKLRKFTHESVFKLLTDTGDLEFAKWFIENLQEIKNDRLHITHSKGIDNTNSLLDLMRKDDMKLFEFSMLYSSKDALNKTLKGIPVEKVEYMIILVNAGANYIYRDGYSGHDIEMLQVSETIRHLLKQLK